MEHDVEATLSEMHRRLDALQQQLDAVEPSAPASPPTAAPATPPAHGDAERIAQLQAQIEHLTAARAELLRDARALIARFEQVVREVEEFEP